MSNSELSHAKEVACKHTTEPEVQQHSQLETGAITGVAFTSARSLPVPFEVPSSGVALPSRPFSPTAPEFIPGAIYTSRQAVDTAVEQVKVSSKSSIEVCCSGLFRYSASSVRYSCTCACCLLLITTSPIRPAICGNDSYLKVTLS